MAENQFQSKLRNVLGSAFRSGDAFITAQAASLLKNRRIKYRQIGFVHIRKSWGTSVVNSVSRAICGSDAMVLHADTSYRHVARHNDYTMVGWHNDRLRRGLFDFGYTHSPWHETFRLSSAKSFVTVRDPLDRVASLWRMYHGGSTRNERLTRRKAQHAGEMRWGAGSFENFLEVIPVQRANELTHSFAADGSSRSALNAILEAKVRVFFLDDLRALEEWLSAVLELEIRISHDHRSLIDVRPDSEGNVERITELLAPDLSLYRMLREQA